MKRSKAYTILFLLVCAAFILSVSIAIPILYRPFYYHHIQSLNLPAETGHSADELKTTYNEVMDYCTGLRSSFSAGVFPYSQEGEAHFTDVRSLFILDLSAGIISVISLLLILIWGRIKKLKFFLIGRHGPAFWAPVILIISFILIGGIASLDFSRAFAVFHGILFPGKDNWLFSETSDPIINALPEAFFQNCAAAVVVNILLISALFLLSDWIWRKNNSDY